MTRADQFEVEVFFDGDCPLCVREIRMLRRLDRKGLIQFTDIAASDFDAEALGRTHDEMMGTIHGRTRDGTWIRGVEVFRALYGAVGFGPLVALSRWKPLDILLNRSYEVFARNRLRWTGRCEGGTCRVPSGAN